MIELKKAHKSSTKNREELTKAKRCGCFHCNEIFTPIEIKKWVDNDQTAICPKCGIDSVIPENDEIQITNDLLGCLYLEYFNY